MRLSITGAAPTGSRVWILLYQQNPVLGFYMVESLDLDSPQEGWVPAPFMQCKAPE